MPSDEAVAVTLGEPRRRTELLVEAIALLHQIGVLKRSVTRRPCFRGWDRLFWILLSWWWPHWREALLIVQPETVVRWRRDVWSTLWRYRSGGRWRGRRPKVSREVRELIVRMVRENFLCAQIHGELLMLGFEVSQATVSRYMPAADRRPGQAWRTFLRNQAIAFSHTQCPEQDSDSESLTLWNRSGGGGEAARAGLNAARGCCVSGSKRSLPVRRLGTAPRRSRNDGDDHFPTRVPMRSPPFRAQASPRLRHRAHGVWTDQILSGLPDEGRGTSGQKIDRTRPHRRSVRYPLLGEHGAKDEFIFLGGGGTTSAEFASNGLRNYFDDNNGMCVANC